MELFLELLLTVFFAFFFSFIVAKLVSVASRETDDVPPPSGGGTEARRRVEGDVREVVNSVDDDVAVERMREGGEPDEVEDVAARVSEEESVGGDGGSFESSGAIGENVEKIGVDDVAVYEEKIVEHLAVVDCAIVRDVGSDGDSFECSGAIGENIGENGDEGENSVNLEGNDQVVGNTEEMIVEHLKVDDVIVEDDGGDGGSFESSRAVSENIEKIGVEDDIRVNLGSSDLIVEERSGDVRVDNNNSESSRVNDDNIESIGVEGDIMVNLGRRDPVVNEVALEEKSDGSELEDFKEDFIEHVGVEIDSSENSGANNECVESVGVGVDEDDDWEGIERSELEENFAAAANYVFYSEKNISEPKLDNNVKMELYGLNKVALEGPCREAQPLAIKVSARAKWNAWQKLGNMSPELAMEQYISLLSEKSPEWMESKSSGDGSKYSSTVSEATPPDIKESVSELNSATPTDGSISVNKI